MELSKGNLRNDFIMFFLLGVSAIPYIDSSLPFTIFFAVVLFGLFLTSKNQKIDAQLFQILIAVLLCIMFQSLIFSYFKLITIVGLILRIFTGYFAVKLLKGDFVKSYLRIIIFFSIVSLIIFIPIFVHPSLLDTIINATPGFLSYHYDVWGEQLSKKSLILFNLSPEVGGLVRNPGPFWEPGAFGGFLIIALILNTIRESRLSTKSNWLFFITIISTQSTTAYLALFAFIILYLLFQNYSAKTKSLAVIFGIAGWVAFQTIPFLGDKIKDQNNNAQEDIETVGGDSRAASAILDWNDIRTYPFSGRGIWPETRVDKKFEYIVRNNGFTNFIAQWGIFFFCLYFFYYYQGFSIYCKFYKTNKFMPVLMLSIVWLISMSEDYFSLQFFWALAFLNISLSNFNVEGIPQNDFGNNAFSSSRIT